MARLTVLATHCVLLALLVGCSEDPQAPNKRESTAVPLDISDPSDIPAATRSRGAVSRITVVAEQGPWLGELVDSLRAIDEIEDVGTNCSSQLDDSFVLICSYSDGLARGLVAAIEKLDGHRLKRYGLLIVHTADATDPQLHTLMRLELQDFLTNMVEGGVVPSCPVAVAVEGDAQLQTKISGMLSAKSKEIRLSRPDGGLWQKVYGGR